MTKISGANDLLLIEMNPVRMKMDVPGNHIILSLTAPLAPTVICNGICRETPVYSQRPPFFQP